MCRSNRIIISTYPAPSILFVRRIDWMPFCTQWHRAYWGNITFYMNIEENSPLRLSYSCVYCTFMCGPKCQRHYNENFFREHTKNFIDRQRTVTDSFIHRFARACDDEGWWFMIAWSEFEAILDALLWRLLINKRSRIILWEAVWCVLCAICSFDLMQQTE